MILCLGCLCFHLALRLCRYDGVSFGLANAWVWLQSNMTIKNKVQTLVERIVGKAVCCYGLVSDMWSGNETGLVCNENEIFLQTL